VALGAAVVLAGVGFFLRHRAGSRRRELLDQLFWYRTLQPFQSLTGDAAMARLQKLSQTAFDHPNRGRTHFSYGILSKKLREVQEIDVRQVLVELTGLGADPEQLRIPVAEPAPAEADPAAVAAAVAARQAAPARKKAAVRCETEVGATA
jgi:hypothetical protein